MDFIIEFCVLQGYKAVKAAMTQNLCRVIEKQERTISKIQTHEERSEKTYDRARIKEKKFKLCEVFPRVIKALILQSETSVEATKSISRKTEC